MQRAAPIGGGGISSPISVFCAPHHGGGGGGIQPPRPGSCGFRPEGREGGPHAWLEQVSKLHRIPAGWQCSMACRAPCVEKGKLGGNREHRAGHAVTSAIQTRRRRTVAHSLLGPANSNAQSSRMVIPQLCRLKLSTVDVTTATAIASDDYLTAIENIAGAFGGRRARVAARSVTPPR